MKKVVKYITGITAFMAVGIIILGFIGYLILLIPPVQQKVLKVAEKEIDKLLAGTISIGSISTNFLSAMDMYDIVVKDTITGTDSLRVTHVRANFNLPMLLTRKVMFSRIDIDDVTGSFSIRSDTTIALPMLPRPIPRTVPSRNGPHWKVRISTITVKKIDAVFTDSVFGQHGEIKNSSATVHIPEVDSITLITRIKNGTYTSNWWNGNIALIDGNVTFFPQKLRINRILLETDHTRLSGKGDVPFEHDGIWDLNASIASDVSAIPALFNNVPGWSKKGSVSADLSWIGSFRKPQLRADLIGVGLSAQDITADSIVLHSRYDSTGEISLHVALKTPYGTADVNGSMQLPALFTAPAPGGYSGMATFNRIALAAIPQRATVLPPQLEHLLLSGTTRVKADSIGIPDSIETALIATRIPYLRKPAAITARLSGSKWETAVTIDGNTISATGKHSDFTDISGTVTASLDKPSTFSRLFLKDPVKGAISADATFQLTEKLFAGDARVSTKHLTWRGAAIDSLFTNFSWNNQQQQLHRFYLTGNAVLDTLLTPFNIDSTTGTAHFFCTGSGHLFTPDLALEVTGSHLAYNRFFLDSISLSGTCRALDTIQIEQCTLIKNSQKVAIDGKGIYHLHSSSGRVLIDFLDITGGQWKNTGRLSLKGAIRADSCDVSFSVTPLSLASLSSFFPVDTTVYGTLQSSGTLSGAFSNPDIFLNVQLSDIRYTSFSIAALQIETTLSDSLANIRTQLLPASSCAPIYAGATIPLLPGSSWKIDTSGFRECYASVKGKNILVGPLLRNIDSSFIADGNISINLETILTDGEFPLTGTLALEYGNIYSDKPSFTAAGIAVNAVVDGTVMTPRVAYTLDGGPVTFAESGITGLHFKGELSKEYLTISRAEITLPDSGLLSLTGMMPLKKSDGAIDTLPGGIDFIIQRLPLTLLQPFLPENTSLHGMVQGTGVVTLIGGTPHINGTATLSHGKLYSDDIKPPIGPINAAITFSGDSIAISPLKAKWGKGTLKGEGYIQLRKDSLPFCTFDITAENCSWTTPDIYSATIDRAEVRLRTNDDTYTIDGNVLVGPTRYIQDLQISTIIETFRKQSTKSLPITPDPILEKVNLNLILDLQENVNVDMNLGYLTLDGKCTLLGTLADPSYIGEFSITNGYVLYLDRQFSIDKATLYSFSPHRFNPQIDLEAEADVVSMTGDQMETFTIVLTLKGELNNAVFTLREKSGELNELDIVSILTFGQRPSGMSGDVKDRLKAFVSQSLLGFGTRKLEQFLGIERIDFKGELFADDGESNGQLTIAKRVTPRLMVLYETDIDNLNKPKISALYRITNNIFISGESDAEGDAGVDLIFKYSK